MTEAEREMMNPIQMYGLFLTLDDGAQNIVLDRMESILKEDEG